MAQFSLRSLHIISRHRLSDRWVQMVAYRMAARVSRFHQRWWTSIPICQLDFSPCREESASDLEALFVILFLFFFKYSNFFLTFQHYLPLIDALESGSFVGLFSSKYDTRSKSSFVAVSSWFKPRSRSFAMLKTFSLQSSKLFWREREKKRKKEKRSMANLFIECHIPGLKKKKKKREHTLAWSIVLLALHATFRLPAEEDIKLIVVGR